MRVARRAAVRLDTRLKNQEIFTRTSDAAGLTVGSESDILEEMVTCAPREESCWEIWLRSRADCFWKWAVV
jgi:hypothetical protein